MDAHDDGDTMIMGVTKSHIKGKRTKRRRPSPSLTLVLASTSTSSSSSTTSETDALTNHSGFFQMPSTTSIDFTNIDNHTTNDQHIANCLMLLAQGQGHNPLARFSSNMVMPVSVSAPVPSRSYVYECKTCDRDFTSFQALGGHRASHNKCKGVFELATNKTLSCNPSGSTKGPKVHACSICGSEFTSGQALGGHMRRHRSMTMATTSTTMAGTTCNISNESHESKKHKTVLTLDLNLPAPVEDDHKEITDDSFGSNNQIIVFSAPTLVDCHF